jgi:hypothetical protein
MGDQEPHFVLNTASCFKSVFPPKTFVVSMRVIIHTEMNTTHKQLYIRGSPD